MNTGRLSHRQKTLVGVMLLAVLGVAVAIGSLFTRQAVPAPIPTIVLPVAQPATATAVATVRSSTSIPTPPGPTITPTAALRQVVVARQIAEIERKVGMIRELPKQQEIPLNFLGFQQSLAVLRRLLADNNRRSFVQNQQALLAALDLSPSAGEAFPPTARTRAKHVVAFYEPGEAQIFLGESVRDDGSPDISLVHQYAHAYLDQHFDLASFLRGAENGDAMRARDALVEGDATAVLAIYASGTVERADLNELASHLANVELTDYEGYISARSMKTVFEFPYRDGARFVAALLRQGWWPAVNSVYLNPPASTEQILHPEKYLANPRDRPRLLEIPDLGEELGDEWQFGVKDVLGELLLREHLDQYLPSSQEAAEAAEGWAGDLAVLWHDDDQREVFVINSAWDTDDDAKHFAQAYSALIQRRLTNATRVLRSTVPRSGRWWRSESASAYLQQTGEQVLVIWAPDTETMERLLAVLVVGE